MIRWMPLPPLLIPPPHHTEQPCAKDISELECVISADAPLKSQQILVIESKGMGNGNGNWSASRKGSRKRSYERKGKV